MLRHSKDLGLSKGHGADRAETSRMFLRIHQVSWQTSILTGIVFVFVLWVWAPPTSPLAMHHSNNNGGGVAPSVLPFEVVCKCDCQDQGLTRASSVDTAVTEDAGNGGSDNVVSSSGGRVVRGNWLERTPEQRLELLKAPVSDDNEVIRLNKFYDDIVEVASGPAKELLELVDPALTTDPMCVIWDVGANLCGFTQHLLVNTNCTIFAFEPMPLYASYCMMRFGHTGRVNVYPIAAGASFGVATLHSDSNNLGWNTIVADATNKGTHRVKVAMAPVSLVVPPSIKPLAIKIDVEGFEYSVLQGMKKSLEAFSPDVPPLVIEVAWGPKGHPNWDEEADAIEHLFEIGYRRAQYEFQETRDVLFSPANKPERPFQRPFVK